ncbi:uncharacterized protein LOC134838004 [Culicoides brevitarsis]|uniref:uncharacterized protein LOC134838004 n=1 Tax=Culicoides brevitarsis TaxID=469753 RepID=UPI00307BA39B
MKEIAVFIIVLASVITYSSAHSCYVCGNGADEPFTSQNSKNTSIPSSCDEFENSNEATPHPKFIRECPPNYFGCSLEIEGRRVIRTCETRTLNDTKMANGVIYSYCNSNLCNWKKADVTRREQKAKDKQEKERKKVILQSPPTDDEDLDEASGMGDPSNYSGERQRQYTVKHANNNYGGGGKAKEIMQITLAPATEALNHTTPRTVMGSNSGASSNVLSLALILLGVNLWALRQSTTGRT